MSATTLTTPVESTQDRRSTTAYKEHAGRHFDKLDHLRFLAAVMILFHHAVPAILCAVNGVACEAPNSAKLTACMTGVEILPRALVFEGHSAVALFITLSGFLFARICGRDAIHYGKFILNRVLRIYPMYLGAIFLATYLSPGNNGIVNLLTSLFCLQNLASPVTHELITPPLWTVAVEFQFYLLFPFFLKTFAAKGPRPILLLLLASLAVKALVYLNVGTVRDLCYQTLFGRIDQFVIGMLAGWYYSRYEHKLRHPALMLLAGAGVLAMFCIFHLKGGFWGSANRWMWIFWPLLESALWCSVIVTYCSSSFSFSPKVSKVLCGLGAISFSMYICHYGFAHLLARKAAPAIVHILNNDQHGLHALLSAAFAHSFYGSVLFAMFVVLPVTLLFSTLTYHAIEKPFMDMKVRYKKSKNQ